MQDGNHLIARIADSHMPTHIMESEVWGSLGFSRDRSEIGFFCEQVATMKFVLERTSIPVPKILAYELDQSHPLGAHILLEKVRQTPNICPFFPETT